MWFRIIQHVLPRARAWRITTDKYLRQFFDGLVGFLADIRVFFDLIWCDYFAQKTRQLDLWEQEYALPDTGLTEQERRDRLEGRKKSLGGQSPRYLQDTLQGEGFDVYIHEWWWDIPQEIIITGTGTGADSTATYDGTVNDLNTWVGPDPFTGADINYSVFNQRWTIRDNNTFETWSLEEDYNGFPSPTGFSIGSLGSPAPTLSYPDLLTVRNPLLYLRRGQGLVTYLNECGEALAECGEALAECGESLEPTGYPIVNKFIESKQNTLSLCGEALMECGELEAICGDFLEISDQPKEYVISGDPDTFPYFLYIGGEIFPDAATVDSKRRDEFETLCLKISPCQQWLGMLINYS